MNTEQWENEGGYIQLTHSYFDGMGFEETHEGSMQDCTLKKCVRERRFWRTRPEIDPWDGGPDPWMEGSLNARRS
ncbi:hypothetical protein SEA_FAUST_196 [Streptomyces phage Faust]|uniref:Uncharacterized protein n=1 Tax=Streptomyces phage Faust TaxID=2767565 RepID=A0A7G9UZ13_9CAUD|nr:hypothetical protein PP456_gp091 [Streptomyces phage Faust]QNN99268.1 hypothetical protein SEA_FAUST_196 [Streptomyces phage Faust]